MNQPEVSLPWLRSVCHLQYANFVLQAKNAVDEATTSVCKPAACSGTWNSPKQSTWAQTVNFRVTMQEFNEVGGYLTNHRTVKIGGWALARDNTVLNQIMFNYCHMCVSTVTLTTNNMIHTCPVLVCTYCTRYLWHGRVTPAILGLYMYILGQTYPSHVGSIREHWSYIGSSEIILELPNSPAP